LEGREGRGREKIRGTKVGRIEEEEEDENDDDEEEERKLGLVGDVD